MIKLTQKAVYFGPNPYSNEPVLVADLHLQNGIAAKSAGVISAIEDLHSQWFRRTHPELDGGDSELIVDFILDWALSALTYAKGYLSARGLRKTGENAFCVWLAFHEPEIAIAALELAVRQCVAVAGGRASRSDMENQLQALWRMCAIGHPGTQARIQMEAARAHDLPCMKAWGARRHWQFGWGARSIVTTSSTSNADGFVSGQLVADKEASKFLIEQLALPAPGHVLVNSAQDIPAAMEKIGFPCVVKPIDQGGGKGVSAGLENIEQVRYAYELARKYTSRPIMLETFVQGSDHRLLCLEGRLIAAFRRDPSCVTGDGIRTIRQLVDELNKDRVLPGADTVTKFGWVALDDFELQTLARQGLGPESIPAAGRRITLRGNANVSTGGTSTDVTAAVHPDIRIATESLAQTLQVRLAGFDYITTDIGRSWREVSGNFIELNIYPGLEALTLTGTPATEVGMLALGDKPGRIPVDCVIVTDEDLEQAKSRCSELLKDRTCGWASHDSAQIGNVPLQVRPFHPWAGVRTLLANRLVQRALVLVSSRHLRSYGFPVDRSDRAWCCDDALPRDWLDVLESASASPVRHGEWRDCIGLIGVDPAG